MWDVIFILLTLILLAVSVAYVHGCEKL